MFSNDEDKINMFSDTMYLLSVHADIFENKKYTVSSPHVSSFKLLKTFQSQLNYLILFVF